MITKSIVIVNPGRYTGYGYINLIKNYFPGYYLIGLWSLPELRTPFTNKAIGKLDQELFYEENFEEIVSKLKVFNPSAFLVGDDLGFPLADRLQHYFFPEHSNDPDKHSYRISKLDGFSYLEKKGLISTNQFLLSKDTLHLCKNKKVVVKPVTGAGNVDVHVNPDFSIIEKLIDSKTTYMVQDFLEGPEYCIEISSYKKNRRCTMASMYKGEYLVDNIFPWREENELISPNHPDVKILYDFIVPILDELGVNVGLTWSQIKMNNGVPHLVEINYRSQGHAVVGPIQAATGNNWATDSLRSFLHINKFDKDSLMYKKKGDFNKICVNNKRQRYIDKLDWSPIEKIESLSHYEVRHHLFPGIVPISKNFNTVMGMIMIQSNDRTQYNRDMKTINQWKDSVSS